MLVFVTPPMAGLAIVVVLNHSVEIKGNGQRNCE